MQLMAKDPKETKDVKPVVQKLRPEVIELARKVAAHVGRAADVPDFLSDILDAQLTQMYADIIRSESIRLETEVDRKKPKK